MFKKFQALAKGGKYVYETLVPKIAKNLAKKRKQQDDVIKTRDKIIKEYGITDPTTKTELRKKANQPKINKKISDIYEKYEKKSKGGRAGKKFGGGITTRKSNVQKIKETFAPKAKKLSPKQMKIAKLAGDPKRIDAPDFKKLRGRA